MATMLKGMRITHISLVKNPANREELIWKSGGKAPSGYEPLALTLPRFMKSDEKRMAYSLVYMPGRIDAQGEYSSAEEIAKAAYGFMKDLRALNVDVQHDFAPKDAYVAESWLTKGVDPLFPDAPEGSWAVGIRIDDDALWESVKKGELVGVSMAGFAQRVRDAGEGNSGILKGLEEFFSRFTKAGSAEKAGEKNNEPASPDKSDGALALDRLAKSLEPLAGLPDVLKGFEERLAAVEKATPGLTAGPVDAGRKNEMGTGGIL